MRVARTADKNRGDSLYHTFASPVRSKLTAVTIVTTLHSDTRTSPTDRRVSISALRQRASNLIDASRSQIPKERKQILEIGEPKQKLKEMRKVIEEMARGEDRSDLFPTVVKNVVAKSVELRKLVYQYVVRYAEELPDIALLSISSFQKGLKDPNQLIRASALRVLSSIRVDVIIPIVQIAVNQVRFMRTFLFCCLFFFVLLACWAFLSASFPLDSFLCFVGFLVLVRQLDAISRADTSSLVSRQCHRLRSTCLHTCASALRTHCPSCTTSIQTVRDMHTRPFRPVHPVSTRGHVVHSQ